MRENYFMDYQEEENIDDEPSPVTFEADIGSGERTEGEKETLKMILQIPVQGANQAPPLAPDQVQSAPESGSDKDSFNSSSDG
jgi:hypothetical protein